MRHVVVMTMTGAIGLMALFVVDLADLFFLALLEKTEITAAVGFAGTAAFINLSISIGLGIAAAALVARNLGAGNSMAARHYATSALIVTLVTSILLGGAMAIFVDQVLGLLGAGGAALEQGRMYLLILIPGFPLLAGAIGCNFALRALGDARRATYATLAVAVVNAILDPLFIFGLGLEIKGAALASVCANLASFSIAIYGLQGVHRFLERPALGAILQDLKPIFAVAGPAILTQLATPFAVAYLTRASAAFGNETVTAVAIINRLTPVAYGVVFSLSGAVGPIVGQNYGARLFDRVRQTLTDALIFSAVYTVATSIFLFLLREQIPAWFQVTGQTAGLVEFYCTWLGITWAFAGAQFVAQAAFNNLGRAHWSTAFNWGKATIGTIPFIWLGAAWGGALGIIIASVLGSVIFGMAATVTAYWYVGRISRQAL
jgi:putative MATE family efflux protein